MAPVRATAQAPVLARAQVREPVRVQALELELGPALERAKAPERVQAPEQAPLSSVCLVIPFARASS